MDHRSNPYVASAIRMIDAAQSAGQPVWVDVAVRDILAEHPECRLSADELQNIIRDLVIEQRWALAQ